MTKRVNRVEAGMGVQLISIEGTIVKMEVTIELSRSMLTSEENIQQAPERNRMYCYRGSPERVRPLIDLVTESCYDLKSE